MSVADGPGGAGLVSFGVHEGRRQPNLDTYLALAVGAAVGTLARHAAGDPTVKDLPLGAVVIDHNTGKGYPGVCLDYETGAGRNHAEQVALDAATADGVDPSNASVVTTFEPCGQCVHMLADYGVSDVLYVSERGVGERLGIVRPGRRSAPNIAAQRQSRGLSASRFHQVQDPAWRAACASLLSPFSRDMDGGRGAEVLHFHSDRVGPELSLLHSVLGSEVTQPHTDHRLALPAVASFITSLFTPVEARA